MKGRIRLARILSPATTDNGYRCDIEALDTTARYVAVCNPSPYGWINPDVGALVYFLDAPYAKRVIGVLHDVDVSTRTLEETYNQEEPSSSVRVMNPGDAYYGKYGRASFPRNGDVDIVSFSTRSRIYLEQSTGTSYFSGYNLDLFTQGQPIRLYTECSAGQGKGVGDILHVQSNSTGDKPKNITDVKLGATGDLTVRVGYQTVGPTGNQRQVPGAAMDVLGAKIIQAWCGGETFGGATVAMKMDGAAKAIAMNTAGNLSIGVTGTANFMAKDLIVKAKVDSTGNVKVTGDTEIMGKTKFTGDMSVAGKVLMEGNEVNLKAQQVLLGAAASMGVVIAEKLIAAFNSHTHVASGPGAPTAPPMVPLTAVQIASTKVKIAT